MTFFARSTPIRVILSMTFPFSDGLPSTNHPGISLCHEIGKVLTNSDRLLCISLIREAAQSGCRLGKACDELGVSLRTFQRWVGDGDAVRADGRTTTGRPPPSSRLSEAERQQILEVANSAEFASLPPSQIVPSLADRGVYLASESSFYRVLRSASQQHHRGRRASLQPGW